MTTFLELLVIGVPLAVIGWGVLNYIAYRIVDRVV